MRIWGCMILFQFVIFCCLNLSFVFGCYMVIVVVDNWNNFGVYYLSFVIIVEIVGSVEVVVVEL